LRGRGFLYIIEKMSQSENAKKILLVDDDEFFIEFERSFIQRKHFEILEARNGSEALEVIRKHNPDLVLLDLYMPGMDGLEVIARMRAEGYLEIPVIVVSNEQSMEKIRELKEAGAGDYLTKPIDIDELVLKVNKFLNETVRSDRRLPVSIKLKYRALDELLSGESRDLSTTGIFVRTRKNLEVGNLVELFLYSTEDADAEPIRLMGEVVRTVENDREEGAGLKFINLRQESIELIRQLLESEQKRVSVDVMALDDDKLILEMLRDGLTEAGWSVKTMTDPMEALKSLNDLDPSLILLDVNMPNMNGIEFCETFRKNAKHENTPFIFISSQVDKETIMRARKSGATFFIAKPFDMANVVGKVRQILGEPKSSPAGGSS